MSRMDGKKTHTHTPIRYKFHPILYSGWSMCTVFYTTNIFRVLEHRVESTVVFRSSFNIMARRTSNAGVEERKGYSPRNDHTTSASSTPLPFGSWIFNTGTQLHVRTEKLRMPNGWRTIKSLVHKIRLHGCRGKGMAESFSREKLRHAPQKEGGLQILCDLPPL